MVPRRIAHSRLNSDKRGRVGLRNRTSGAASEPPTQNSQPSRSIIGFGAWSWIAALLVIYGSLIPFDFHIPSFRARLVTVVHSLNVHTSQLDDFVINVLLYVPLGALFALARRKNRSISRSVLPSIALAGLISIAVETLQIFLPARVPSIMDVILNISGASIGALVVYLCAACWIRMMDRVIAEFDRQPSHVLAIVITCALLLQAALPFDFISTTSGLHDVFRRASQLSLGLSAAIPSQTPTAMISHIAIAGWFALLGFLTSQNEKHDSPGSSILAAAWRAAILVFLMEMIGLFRSSHAFDAATVFLRILAAAFGAWCAAFVWNTGHSFRTLRRSNHVPLGWLVVSGCVLALTIIGDRSSGTHAVAGHASIASFEIRMPFEALWRASTATCVPTLFIGLMDYAALSAITIAILRRVEMRGPHFWSVLLNLTVAMAQSMHSFSLHQVFDFTMPILAGFTALLIAQCKPRTIMAPQ